MNHIIISKDDCATIIGSEAHKLKDHIRTQQGDNRFFVYDGQTLVAAQPTKESAMRYMTPERVMVEVPGAQLGVGSEILIDTCYGLRRASVTGWRWPHLTIDPVSVLIRLDEPAGFIHHTFATMKDFRRSYCGQYA